jgi:hypothetical protein
MSLNNNNGSQTNQPLNDESFTQILPHIQMMLSAAMNQQASMFQNTVKEMTQDIAQLKMTVNALQKQPTPPSSSSATKIIPKEVVPANQAKGKKALRPSVPIPKPSEPPNKTATPPTQRAVAVATNLERQDFRRAQSEPLAC